MVMAAYMKDRGNSAKDSPAMLVMVMVMVMGMIVFVTVMIVLDAMPVLILVLMAVNRAHLFAPYYRTLSAYRKSQS